MRYWVYINDKVDGPFEEDKLATLNGFTPETLICSEEIEEGANQEWVKASAVFEFDEATKTMTRAPLSQQELQLQPAPQEENAAGQAQPLTQDHATTQILIEKIDHLTREIEGLKGKLDQALAASAAAAVPPAPALTQPLPAPETAAPTAEKPAPVLPEEATTEEGVITNTESLMHHAESLVAQASSTATSKPIDFLDEIQIGAAKNPADKGGEEVVLRSALDSLYGVKEQAEEEKEATFQDLLSPLTAAATVGAGAAVAAALSQKDGEEKEETLAEPAAQAQPEQKMEEAPAEQPAAQPQEAEPAPAQASLPISEEKREEIINEITAPAQQNDLILQALQEAQKEQEAEQPQVEPVATPEVEPAAQPVEEPAMAVQPAAEPLAEPAIEPVVEPIAQPAVEPVLEPVLDLNPLEEQPAEAAGTDLPQDKQPLDLSDQPQLNIVGGEETPLPASADPAQPTAHVPDLGSINDALTPMNPDAPEAGAKEVTETVKELVPGKKLENTEPEGLISQADLDEAFTERRATPADDFPLPEGQEPPASQAAGQTPAAQNPGGQQPAAQEAKLPEGQGFYNPNEMTEVELKEGSTYLISDFIPPAEAKSEKALLEEQKARLQKQREQAGALPGSTEAAQQAVEQASQVTPEVKTEFIEEIVPDKKDPSTDLSLSKVILENTIKTKRGASMDIKTVPMVQEPADTDRLDLSESGLDINTQHDMKEADFQQPSTPLIKIVLGGLVSLVLLALIYVMLAYLELLPSRFNFIKSAPQQEEVLGQDEQLNELLEPPTQTAAQPMQLPAGVDSQIAPQPMQTQDNPLAVILTQVKNLPMVNGQTLQQLINSRHPATQEMIEWNITTAVEPDNYSVLVKVPPENPQSFKISYRFNYNAVTGALEPTISDSKNLLDSLRAGPR